jgi:hypothetical protein
VFSKFSEGLDIAMEDIYQSAYSLDIIERPPFLSALALIVALWPDDELYEEALHYFTLNTSLY